LTLKKLVTLVVAAFVVLTSCNNTELYENESIDSNAIDFSTYVNTTSRTTDITNKTIKDFTVYGLSGQSSTGTGWNKILDNETVTAYDSNASGWSYPNVKYWTKGLYYRFLAIAPATTNAALTFDADGTDNATISYTNIQDNPQTDGRNDLLYAYKGDIQGLATGNLPVKLEFNHLLARVKFRFVATNEYSESGVNYNPANAHYAVYNVKLKGTYKLGSINVKSIAKNWHTQTWLLSDANKDLSGLNFGEVKYQKNTSDALTSVSKDGVEYYYFDNDGSGDTDPLYIIPSTNSNYSLTFDFEYFLTVPDGNGGYLKNSDNSLAGTWIRAKGEIKAADMPKFAMQIGYSYVYTIHINAKNITKRYESDPETTEPIQFTVSDISSWQN
jgi:hypothetical protein